MWGVGGSKYTTLNTLIENSFTHTHTHMPVHFCTSLSRGFSSILIFLITITIHLLKLPALWMLGTISSHLGRMCKLESIGDTSPPLVLVLGLTVRP